MFKDIPTFLGLAYRDASHITLYLVVIGISIPKIRSIGFVVKKVKNQHFFVASIEFLNRTNTGITKQYLKSIGQF